MTASRSTSRSSCARARPITRPEPAAPLPCPARCPRCSTSRSWPGSTPRRRRCRWPRPSPPPGPRSIARCSPRPCRSRPEELDASLRALVDARVLEPDRGPSGPLPVPARAAARGRVRAAAALVAPQGARPALRCPHPRRAERLACPRVALRACGAPPGGGGRLPAHGRVGAAAWGAGRGPRRTSRGRSTSSMPLADDAARDHREVELRLRRGFLAMSAEGAASADASADFDRCLELAAADPTGDDMFSTLISRVGLRPVTGRARPRPPAVRDAARRPRRRA